jgi:hypothetical protein
MKKGFKKNPKKMKKAGLKENQKKKNPKEESYEKREGE